MSIVLRLSQPQASDKPHSGCRSGGYSGNKQNK